MRSLFADKLVALSLMVLSSLDFIAALKGSIGAAVLFPVAVWLLCKQVQKMTLKYHTAHDPGYVRVRR